MFLPHFDIFCELLLNQTHGNMESIVLYNNEKPFFISKCFNIMRKPPFCPAFARKKAIWRDLLPIQNEAISLVAMRRKELWLVEKNRATVKPDSSVTPRWMKTYSRRVMLGYLPCIKSHSILRASRLGYKRLSGGRRKSDYFCTDRLLLLSHTQSFLEQNGIAWPFMA